MVLRSVLKALDIGTSATFTIVESRLAMIRPSAAVSAMAYRFLAVTLLCSRYDMSGRPGTGGSTQPGRSQRILYAGSSHRRQYAPPVPRRSVRDLRALPFKSAALCAIRSG